MPFMLVTLFAFALLVTLAGFFLSYQKRARERNALISQSRARRPANVDRRGVGATTSRLPRAQASQRAPQRLAHYERPVRVIANRPTRALSLSSSSGLGRLGARREKEPINWTVVVIGLGSVFVLGLFAFNLLVAHNNILWFSAANSISQNQSTPSASNKPPQLYGASQHLQRIGQLDPGQYNSTQEYSLWAYSACSTAAMAEVFNAYGRHYRVTDVLKVEATINAITPALGLVTDSGISSTASQFGFKTSWGYSLSYDQVVATANRGEPVIVAWPPSRYDGGHLVVVVGGNSQTILIADSSIYDRHSLSRAQFMKWWAGFSAIVTPQ